MMYLAWGLANVGICAAVAAGCYVSNSAWPLLLLPFVILGLKPTRGKCDKCGQVTTFTRTEE